MKWTEKDNETIEQQRSSYHNTITATRNHKNTCHRKIQTLNPLPKSCFLNAPLISHRAKQCFSYFIECYFICFILSGCEQAWLSRTSCFFFVHQSNFFLFTHKLFVILPSIPILLPVICSLSVNFSKSSFLNFYSKNVSCLSYCSQ